MADTYTPKAGDVGRHPDGNGVLLRPGERPLTLSPPKRGMAPKLADNPVARDTRNRAPVFEDQDTETDGVQNTEPPPGRWRRTR